MPRLARPVVNASPPIGLTPAPRARFTRPASKRPASCPRPCADRPYSLRPRPAIERLALALDHAPCGLQPSPAPRDRASGLSPLARLAIGPTRPASGSRSGARPHAPRPWRDGRSAASPASGLRPCPARSTRQRLRQRPAIISRHEASVSLEPDRRYTGRGARDAGMGEPLKAMA
jgi:hypothetical protein